MTGTTHPTSHGLRRHSRAVGVVAGICAALMAFAPTAGATVTAGPGTRALPDKSNCLAKLDERLAQVARLKSAVAGAAHLASSHASTLNSKLDGTSSGLTALRATIVADTDRATTVADCLKQATDYRVYSLLTPQVHLTRAADLEAFIATRVGGLTPRIQRAIDAAAAAGKDVTAAKAALADLQTKVADATSKAHGFADALLAITPASFNAGHGAVDNARSAATGLRADLAAIRGDVVKIRAALRH